MLSTRSKIMLLLLHTLRSDQLFTDREGAIAAYNDVRNDGTDTMWAALKYDGKVLAEPVTGTDYADFVNLCGDGDRVYGYVRFEINKIDEDGTPRKAKSFALITWIGPAVGSLKKAAVSTDKAFVKVIWPAFQKEILADELSELNSETIKSILEKAAADYGKTGAK